MNPSKTAIELVQELVEKRKTDEKIKADELKQKGEEAQAAFEQEWRPVLDFLQEAARVYPDLVWFDKRKRIFTLEHGGFLNHSFREGYSMGSSHPSEGLCLELRRGRPHPSEVVMRREEAGEFLPFLIDELARKVVEASGK